MEINGISDDDALKGKGGPQLFTSSSFLRREAGGIGGPGWDFLDLWKRK